MLPDARIPNASQSSWTTTPGASVGSIAYAYRSTPLLVDVRDRDVEVGRGGGHRAEHLASVDPPARRDSGRDRRRPREILTAFTDRGGQHHTIVNDLLERGGERADATLGPGGYRDLVATDHVEHRDQVHVDPDGHRRVTPRQPARGHDQIVRGRHATPAEVDRDRRDEVAGRLQRVDRLERKGPVAVMFRGARGELLRELLGRRDEPRAGIGIGFEFDRHA